MPNPIAFIAAVLFAQSAVAQQPPATPSKQIPIRNLGPITAAAKDTFGTRFVVRGLSNGSVMIGNMNGLAFAGRGRVFLYDATLQHYTTVRRDSASPGQLIRFTGDSTLALDDQSQALLVLDQLGAVARVMAPPKAQDFNGFRGFIRTPWIDAKGRLIYQGVMPAPPRVSTAPVSPFQPDSAPIVRGDFETRTVDTITTIKLARPSSMSTTVANQNITYKTVFDPMSFADEWTMLSDGTIAIVRAQDYHIDWVDPDGSRRSTPKMPFDWRRVTDEQKQARLDSLKPQLDSLAAAGKARKTTGPMTYTWLYETVLRDKLPDYEPPIGPGSVRADLDGNVWIVPRTSAAAKGGVLYDVVNRQGEITERVQFPAGVALIGFGPGGAVYLIRVVDGKYGFLESAKIR